jgi:tetratricopeptide (TPR) repeat protein
MRTGRSVLALAFTLALLLVGCSKDFNTTNTVRYYDVGQRAEQVRDFPTAEDYYQRALVWAGTERVPPAMLSLTMYNLGRMKGYACKFDEARDLLLTSLALEETTAGPVSPGVARRLLELARLYHDRRQHAEALPYFAEAVGVLYRLQPAQSHAAGFADALLDYAVSLRQTGDLSRAGEVTAEAEQRRARQSAEEPLPAPVLRYTASCRSTIAVQGGRA